MVSVTNARRKAGEPLPADLVKMLRDRVGLTQEELAERLGVSGKAIVSGWETGRTTCEGPAAELMLRLFGGRDATALSAEADKTADTVWRRSGTWADTWRQTSFVPEVAFDIERDVFVDLFPGAEIPPEQHVHGFPFVAHGLPSSVFGLGTSGWLGSIPAERERSPHYLWLLTRSPVFLYREIPWELRKDSITGGHTHIGSLLEIATSTTFFLKRLGEKAKLDPMLRFSLRLDIEGMQGRGLVGAARIADLVDNPGRLSPESHLGVSVVLPLKEIASDPLSAAFKLIGELVLLLKPDMAGTAALQKQLRSRLAFDRSHQNMRFMGFLDGIV
jgi:transcriptional regulator with XRE-family HTH domain